MCAKLISKFFKTQNSMRFNHFIVSTAIAMGLAFVWYGCEADVDLNNVDTSVKVDANVALPIGSVTATIGDFVGNGNGGIYVDSLENRGVLTFRDTFRISRNFHQVDLKQYISKTQLKMNVYDKLDGLSLLQDGKITGLGVTIPLEFPLTLKLDGINNDQEYQRLDSALIKNASFTSRITQLGNLPLKWEWIEQVTLTLGDAFHRKDGRILTVYKKGDGYGYDQNIPITVDAFSLNLMKNSSPSTPEQYSNNVIDSCDFKVTMYVTIPMGEVVTIPSTAGFQYNLDVQFIDYHAIWGMFKPSNDMFDDNEITLAEEWDSWKLFQSAKLPFADPSIDMNVTTQIAGALVMTGEHLYVSDKEGNKVNATFDGNESLYKYFNKNEYLGLDSEIGDSATMHILFDKDPARGRIDRLFTIQPDKLGYKFSIDFNRQETPQIRITENTSINIAAACDMPFIFNEGVEIAYSDTIADIDLSMVELDSLMAAVPDLLDTIEEAALTLALQIENSIPLQFKGSFVCLDEFDNVIIDTATNAPWLITNQDTLLIPAPEHTFNQTTATWAVTPAQMTEAIELTKDELSYLAKTKKIIFYAALDDKSLDYAYEQGYFNVKLTEYESLNIRIGVGADIEAILNVGALMNQ